MKIQKKFQLQKAVSGDACRFVLQHIYGDVYQDKTVAVASDGHIMAVVPAEFESPEDIGVVPIEAYKEARKSSPKSSGKRRSRFAQKPKTEPAMVSIQLNGKAEVKTNKATVIFERDTEAFKVPGWPKVVPQGEPKQKLYFNAASLYRLAQALGDDAIELSIYEGGGAMQVRGGNSKTDAFGLIMPMSGHSF